MATSKPPGPGPRAANSPHYQNNTGVKVTRGSYDDTIASARIILDAEILVGVPSETSDRPSNLQVQDENAPTNAVLAYIHDNGAPEANIPQREFMRPGIADVLPEITRKMEIVMRLAMRGDVIAAEMAMQQVGIVAQSGIHNRIDAGIPPPLADYTLRKRDARTKKGSKSAQYEMKRRAQGLAPSVQFARPLIDTGELRKSIMYVIRSRRRRR